jgi:penicillin amidase
MDTTSAAASIWWTFWQAYLSQSFDPWWSAKNVGVDRHELDDALGQDLETMTLAGTAPCQPPSCARPPTCATVECQRAPLNAALSQAFHTAFSNLTSTLGADPASWTWGRIHTRELENLAQVTGLNYGPRASSGDAYTPLAAADSPSTHGPSWRMVVDWGTQTFSGIYPGGQSENPASAWYENKVNAWWSGLYAPMLSADQAVSSSGSATWTMQP